MKPDHYWGVQIKDSEGQWEMQSGPYVTKEYAEEAARQNHLDAFEYRIVPYDTPTQ